MANQIFSDNFAALKLLRRLFFSIFQLRKIHSFEWPAQICHHHSHNWIAAKRSSLSNNSIVFFCEKKETVLVGPLHLMSFLKLSTRRSIQLVGFYKKMNSNGLKIAHLRSKWLIELPSTEFICIGSTISQILNNFKTSNWIVRKMFTLSKFRQSLPLHSSDAGWRVPLVHGIVADAPHTCKHQTHAHKICDDNFCCIDQFICHKMVFLRRDLSY